MIHKRKFIPVITILLIMALLLPSCSAGTGQASSSESSVAYASQINKNSVMTVEISADPEKWQAMLDNASQKEYISADVTINGTTIKNVGIKPKGNSSLKAIAENDDSERYSFKIKFDEYVDGQTWMGLDILALNNNYSDATSMKEYLSYDIMNYIGVDAPLVSYANISVNDKSWGFYLAVEALDSSYLERTKNGEGELYKPDSQKMGGGIVWNAQGEQSSNPARTESSASSSSSANQTSTASSNANEQKNDKDKQFPPDFEKGGGMQSDDATALIYTDDEESSYSSIFDNAETKTNESDHKRVIEAIKNLNSGTDLEKYVDVDATLRYLAAHTAVVNLDSYSSNMGHNYYLYENNGQISMLPWDYNMAFGGFQSKDASSVVNFPIDTPVSGVSMEDRPMISKLLEVPENLKKYHEYLQQILDNYFTNGKFEEKVNEVNTLISSYVKDDPSAFFSFEEYETAVKELKKLGALRAESIQGQLSGTIPSTTEGQKTNSSSLIDSSSVNLTVLGDKGEMERGAPDGMNFETMKKAMEILQSTTNGTITEEKKSQLKELGLTEDQINQMLKRSQKN
ncbi:MAG: CotH kinase family protein [Clostridium sp.]|uniref:CotH kinase family protein n=1 Tax=Clostridium sp. TaxID=1506 RepID=UPI0029118412|nr:CotH kinase family protein [Clostridium sp.]MDU7337291.1 CotH kinase family protein [Clostridium sp.]